MKKVIICLVYIILLTGCSAKVDFNINSDSSVNENIVVSESRSKIKSASVEKYIKSVLDDNFSSGELSDYTIENIIDNNNVGVRMSQSSDSSICLALKKSSLRYLSKSIDCTFENDIYHLTLIPDYLMCKEECYFKPEINNVVINITLPQGSIYDNSNVKNGNTYTWNFSGESDEKIDLKFIVNEEKLQNDVNKSKINNREMILVALGLILIVAVIALVSISLYKKYKARKIEY